MRFASVCDGVSAVSVAWAGVGMPVDAMGQRPPDGWSLAWRSEIDRFCNAVCEHRIPGVPNLGDMEAITHEQLDEHGSADVLVGGTPCQSFSVAGLRKGLADTRGNLALVFLRFVDELRPRWLVWENVPGVLSSGEVGVDGGAIGAFLGALGELGYGFAYRVLDAQFFGVPQRRRRVFVVGCDRGWAPAAAVLLERHCLLGDPAPSRGAGEGVAGTLVPCAHPGGCNGQDACTNQLVPHVMASGQGGAEVVRGGSPTLTCVHEAPILFDETQVTSSQNRSRCEPGSPSPSLAAGARPPTLAFHHRQDPISGEVCHAIDTDETFPAGVVHAAAVRRLTPRECERLQGFPDDWTLVPTYRRRLAEKHRADAAEIARHAGMSEAELLRDGITPDGPRYKAMGNSMVVPVMRWIGRRIEMVEGALEGGAE